MRAPPSAIIPLVFVPAMLLARGDGTFQAPFSAPVSPSALGHFNGDGKVDSASLDTNLLSIALQDPANRTRWHEQAFSIEAAKPIDILSADFDSDGLDDLAILVKDSPPRLLRCLGDGKFEEWRQFDEVQHPSFMITGDWNGDREPDLAIVDDVPRIHALLNQGRGNFIDVQSVIYLPHPPDSMVTLDFNGEGVTDLLIRAYPDLWLFKGQGDGSFDALPGPVQGFVCPTSHATGDLNGDGKGDLAVFCGTKNQLVVGLGLGDGSFEKALESKASVAPLFIDDLDGDGVDDLAIGGGGFLLIYKGRPEGILADPTAYLEFDVRRARDLDGDGRLDLISFGSIAWGRSGATRFELGRPVVGLPPGVELRLGDFDGDGAPDLLVPVPETRTVQVYLGFRGEPLGPPSLTIQSAFAYTKIEMADFDGDGLMDLAGISNSGLGISLLGPDGKVRREYILSSGESSVRAARVDEDSTVDLVVFGGFFLGLGGGEFLPFRSFPSIDVGQYVIGDLDHDGITDIVGMSSSEVAILYGRGGGHFASPISLVQVDPQSETIAGIAVGDLNGDGFDDIVVAGSYSTPVIYAGRPGRVLEKVEEIGNLNFALRELCSIELADLDGNGLKDLIVAKSDAVWISLNRGAEGFDPWTPYANELPFRGYSPLGLEVADLDRDGALDFLVSGPAGVSSPPATGASVLYGRPGTTSLFRRGDANGDGGMDLTDVVRTLYWLFLFDVQFTCPDSADANDDGKIDITDPIAILNRLFLGGAPLPTPGSETCGEDLTPDALGDCRSGGC